MNTNQHRWKVLARFFVLALLAVVWLVPGTPAMAGNTGTITGTVRDSASGAPVAGILVTASAPSGGRTATTDQNGFYSIVALPPDTYTLSFQGNGFEPATLAGITVQQDLNIKQDLRISKRLREIGSVSAQSGGNLVKPNQGTNVYTVTGQQLQAVAGADNLHKTLYEYIQGVPGVTANGYPAQPRIRGGQVTDLAYEFDGIPIQDRITGFFTTNLSNIGIQNVEVYTGGLSAGNAASGTGVLNSVVKSGTYPGFGTVAYGFTTGEPNHYLTLETGGANANRKLSYYLAFDGVNSQNDYNSGSVTFPNVLYYGFNGPGVVKTRDIIGNFHYKPNSKNDIQFLVQNGLGEFVFNYLLSGPNQPLAYQPCVGNTPSATSPTGFGGGTAPNGQTCPAGLAFGPVAPGAGNIWHHYSGIGKLQWNHVINDNSFFAFRIAENFNQYIFDQPLADPNVPALENPGGAYALQPGCPMLPYAAGQPVPVAGGGTCAWEPEVFWGDRHSNMYLAALDYTNNVSAQTTIKLGAGYEKDNNVFNYFLTNSFNGNGTWPWNYLNSNYPTTIPYAYAQGEFHVGKFMLSPGFRYQQEHYGYPLQGGHTVSAFVPTFNGTYTMDPRNVLRFSYGQTRSFVGTGYIYRSGSIPGGQYDPTKPGFNFDPQVNTSGDLMLEHQIDAKTSLKFGPWFNRANNYYENYQPILSVDPVTGAVKFGKAVLSGSGSHNAFGFELGLNHQDPRPYSISYWLSGTYDNYWTNTRGLAAAFVNTPLPQNIVNQGIFVRDPSNPLLSGSLTADIRADKVHIMPFLYYQGYTFYNTGRTCTTMNGVTVAPYICQNEKIARGYFKANLTALTRLGPGDQYTIGIRGTNITNNNADTQPCNSGGSGCFPFNGPQSSVNQAGEIYQNVTQSPPQYEFFFIKKW